jgi:hypothetical protein
MQGPSLQHLGEAEAPGFIPGGSFLRPNLNSKTNYTKNCFFFLFIAKTFAIFSIPFFFTRRITNIPSVQKPVVTM